MECTVGAPNAQTLNAPTVHKLPQPPAIRASEHPNALKEMQKAPRRVPCTTDWREPANELNEFDTSHRRIIAMAGAELQDPGIATIAGGVTGSNFGKQL